MVDSCVIFDPKLEMLVSQQLPPVAKRLVGGSLVLAFAVVGVMKSRSMMECRMWEIRESWDRLNKFCENRQTFAGRYANRSSEEKTNWFLMMMIMNWLRTLLIKKLILWQSGYQILAWNRSIWTILKFKNRNTSVWLTWCFFYCGGLLLQIFKT